MRSDHSRMGEFSLRHLARLADRIVLAFITTSSARARTPGVLLAVYRMSGSIQPQITSVQRRSQMSPGPFARVIAKLVVGRSDIGRSWTPTSPTSGEYMLPT